MNLHKKVLIIEDESQLADLYRTFLTEFCDCDVVLAQDGQAGINAFLAAPDFDLVITDFNMPSVNGFQAASAIKQLSQNTPIVMVTSDASYIEGTFDTDNVLAGIEQKPLPMAKLKSLVEHHCM